MLLRQARAILILPFTVTVIIPFLLPRGGAAEPSLLFRIAGVLLFSLGLVLAASTIWHFATRGQGTLAPWDPTRKLVTSGIYRHVRNPMITGVFLILLGESLWFASMALAVWATVFFTINAVYTPLVEEKGLSDRFGPEYEAYRRHVPRWVPRVSPWNATDPRDEV